MSLLKTLFCWTLVLVTLSFISAQLSINTYYCADICSEEYDPVCIVYKNGTVAELKNQCQLEYNLCKRSFGKSTKEFHIFAMIYLYIVFVFFFFFNFFYQKFQSGEMEHVNAFWHNMGTILLDFFFLYKI